MGNGNSDFCGEEQTELDRVGGLEKILPQSLGSVPCAMESPHAFLDSFQEDLFPRGRFDLLLYFLGVYKDAP